MSRFNTSGQVLYIDTTPVADARIRIYDLDGPDDSGLHDELLDVRTDAAGRFSGRTTTDWDDTEGSTFLGNLPDAARFEFLVRANGKSHRGQYLASNGGSVPIILPWRRPTSTTSPVTTTFTAQDARDAVKLLKDIGDFLGPFAKAALEGRWSLAEVRTPVDLGNGAISIPYGVKVRLTSETARKMAVQNVTAEALTSWGAALGALAALSPAFAAMSGVASAGVVAAAVAVLPAAVVAAAAIILAFIILMLIYGSAISLQLSISELLGNFDDGVVYIEHPTFALALLKGLSLGLVPAELMPPIVTG
jgi:hypothetical protein